jgi:hypothetical protein
MSRDPDNCSKIWNALIPYLKSNSKLTPYKCLGSDEVVSKWYGLLIGPNSSKPFWQTKRSYLAGACLFVFENYSGLNEGVELKYCSPSGGRCRYWNNDGSLKREGWEEKSKFFRELSKFTANEHQLTTFIVQVDITSIYQQIRHLLESDEAE